MPPSSLSSSSSSSSSSPVVVVVVVVVVPGLPFSSSPHLILLVEHDIVGMGPTISHHLPHPLGSTHLMADGVPHAFITPSLQEGGGRGEKGKEERGREDWDRIMSNNNNWISRMWW